MTAILFDLDDTLYPEDTYVRGGFDAVATHAARQGWARSAPEARQHLVRLLARDGRGRVFDAFLEEAGVHSEARAQEMLHVYRTHTPSIRTYADVVPVLRELREHGVPTGLVTDGLASVQERKVSALGIQALVDVVVCTGDLGDGLAKPSEVPFLVALSRLAAPVVGSVYVGNDPRKDFVAPRRLGMSAIHVRRDGAPQAEPPTPAHEAHFTIAGLGELLEVCRRKAS
ncbi:MAG TPA: HAD family hydrolase [Polyangiaceae bacterium]|nr:HAD family hydrolase [Polyangiaceae bacterium]